MLITLDEVGPCLIEDTTHRALFMINHLNWRQRHAEGRIRARPTRASGSSPGRAASRRRPDPPAREPWRSRWATALRQLDHRHLPVDLYDIQRLLAPGHFQRKWVPGFVVRNAKARELATAAAPPHLDCGWRVNHDRHDQFFRRDHGRAARSQKWIGSSTTAFAPGGLVRGHGGDLCDLDRGDPGLGS